jgi:hypothetical protein
VTVYSPDTKAARRLCDRLFISAFLIALKIICDDTYLNISWSIVGQEIFQL